MGGASFGAAAVALSPTPSMFGKPSTLGQGGGVFGGGATAGTTGFGGIGGAGGGFGNTAGGRAYLINVRCWVSLAVIWCESDFD